ncbi:MAG: glycosyl hydrolase [Verrucomicrobiales bacterium]|nr:glycosyl hydrolase [Verrucomicrobiales bacterium]|tara:strand:+ start:138 stop:908 length:771 start_codon:yes stop_codon:yes gene_type:complete
MSTLHTMKRITATLLILTATLLSANAGEKGFKKLFNGKDLSGWRHGGNWEVLEDGSISRKGKGGSLVYTAAKVPDNFELRFEWKVSPGSNSGIYYRPTQYEYQILDNGKHVDGGNPRTSAASLYFCMAPSHDATKKPGEWNTGRVVCQGTVIQHWLNGKKVIDFDYTDKQFAWNVDLLRKRGGDLTARGANLSLQDHGDPVWYRNIRWRVIRGSEDIGHKTVQPVKIAPGVLEKEAAKLKGILERRAKAAAKRRKK